MASKAIAKMKPVPLATDEAPSYAQRAAERAIANAALPDFRIAMEVCVGAALFVDGAGGACGTYAAISVTDLKSMRTLVGAHVAVVVDAIAVL